MPASREVVSYASVAAGAVFAVALLRWFPIVPPPVVSTPKKVVMAPTFVSPEVSVPAVKEEPKLELAPPRPPAAVLAGHNQPPPTIQRRIQTPMPQPIKATQPREMAVKSQIEPESSSATDGHASRSAGPPAKDGQAPKARESPSVRSKAPKSPRSSTPFPPVPEAKPASEIQAAPKDVPAAVLPDTAPSVKSVGVAVPLPAVPLPAAGRPAGLRAKVADTAKFKEKLLDAAARHQATITFEESLIRIGVPAEKRDELRKSVERVIFDFLADDGTDVRIEIFSP